MMLDVSDQHNLTPEQRDLAVEILKDYLPDDARLLQVSYTGGRAFGWGPDRTDIDMKGYFEYGDWFKNCHVGEARDTENGRLSFDFQVSNVKDIENDPDIWRRGFKKYYDRGNPVYVHEAWDQDDFMSYLDLDQVVYEYPENTFRQYALMDQNTVSRTVCHTYKELLILLHYILEEEIEINVVRLNEKTYGYEGLQTAATDYYENGGRNEHYTDDEADMMLDEVRSLFDRAGYELEERHEEYEHDPYFE